MDAKSIEAVDKYVDRLRQVSNSAKDMSETIKEIMKDIDDEELIISLTEDFLELGIIEKDMADIESFICSRVNFDGG